MNRPLYWFHYSLRESFFHANRPPDWIFVLHWMYIFTTSGKNIFAFVVMFALVNEKQSAKIAL